MKNISKRGQRCTSKQNGRPTGHTMRRRISSYYPVTFHQAHFSICKMVKSNRALTEEAVEGVGEEFANFFDDGCLDACVPWTKQNRGPISYHGMGGELLLID